MSKQWYYRPLRSDDWGIVRDGNDIDSAVVCQARDTTRLTEDVLQPFRQSGRDPWEHPARLIAAAPEMLDVLRQWKNAESTSDDAELRCARFARDLVLAKCEGGAE